jgi:hypothetical protein
LLTSAVRVIVLTSDSERPPRVNPNLRIEDSKWNELEEEFRGWLKKQEVEESKKVKEVEEVEEEVKEAEEEEEREQTEAEVGLLLNDEWKHILGDGIDRADWVGGGNFELASQRISFPARPRRRWILVKFLLVYSSPPPVIPPDPLYSQHDQWICVKLAKCLHLSS